MALVEGRMCNTCNGHRIRNKCLDCRDSAIGSSLALRMVMLCVFVFGFFLLVDQLLRYLPSMAICYPGVQVIALLGKFKLGWDKNETRGNLLDGLSIINFNPEFAYLDCTFGWHWSELWWLKMWLPVIVLGVDVCLHYAKVAFDAALKRRVPYNSPVTSTLRLSRMLFIPVLKNNIEVWRCSEAYGDARHVLSAPENDCGTSAIAAKRAFSVVSMVLYVLGVPLLFSAIVLLGWRRKLLSDAGFQKKFGFIYMGFEREWYWWPLKNFVYMGLHTINAVVVESSLMQGCVALMLISLDMLLLFFARPFMEDWKDFLACGYRWTAFCLVIIGFQLNCHSILNAQTDELRARVVVSLDAAHAAKFESITSSTSDMSRAHTHSTA